MENNSFGFKVGDFNCIVISDQNAGDYNVLFVQTGQHQVLIDPGLGHHVFPDSVYPGLLKHKLKGLGIYPTDINLIIYSHADVDHIGDRVDQAGNPAFPHARYVLLKEEVAFWLSKPERLHPSPADDGFLTEELCQIVNIIPPQHLVELHEKLELVDSGTEVLPGIRLIAASGHTPGHSTIDVSSGNDRLRFIGDLIYTPQDPEDPDWTTILDFDAPRAIATRQRIFAQAAHERTLLLGYHLPFPGLGYLTQQGTGWRWTAYDPEARKQP